MKTEEQDSIDFPTLGFLAADWIAAHCKVADGWSMGEPFVHDGWQLWCTVNHYRVRPEARFNRERPVGAPAFANRRSVIVGPQKSGKSPYGASLVCFEAVGPCVFAGWAKGGEVYRCENHGCPCGFEFAYEPGEPMGLPRPVSTIQLMATAESQVANLYRPLQEMINRGPLAHQMKVREGFIRLPNGGRIDPVTASARARLGAPIHFAIFDESGIYTGNLKGVAATMRRGLAGMSGRSVEITNPWDPMDNSTAEESFTANVDDVFRFYRRPPKGLDFKKKGERRKILEHVYKGSPWADVDAIEAEAAELMEHDPTQAMRFFGNMIVQGLGSYIPADLWDSRIADRQPKAGEEICLGFDGSRSGDWTALRAETADGFRFTPTYGPDNRPTWWNPAEWPDGRIPRGEVDAAVSELFGMFRIRRFYVDPRHWETQADRWAALYGEDTVIQWPTNQTSRMYDGLVRYIEDLAEGLTTHSADTTAREHALHARKVAKPGDKYLLGKPAEHMKIDILMADILAHEAASDERAQGWTGKKKAGVIRFNW